MTRRLFIIGTILIVLVCAVVTWGVQVASLQLGVLQFPPPAIAVLLVAVAVNRLLAAVGPRLKLSGVEVAGLYIMTMLATMVSSRGLYDLLIPGLVGLNYFATPANKWADVFFPHVRPSLVPWDPAGDPVQRVARMFYEGTGRWDGWIEFLPMWLKPLGLWLLLAFSLFAAYYFVAAILRRQWVDNERLSFPLVALPLEMINPQGGRHFLAEAGTWCGFALPVIVFGLTGLHEFYPQVPAIPTRGYSVNAWLKGRPWNAISYTPIYLSFAAVGFFFFIPTELLLSLWVFFAFIRMQDVVLASVGVPIRNMPLYPCHFHIGHQVMGGYCVLAGYWAYVTWPHLKTIWGQVVGRQDRANREEMLPYRTAFWGLIVSFGGMMVWSRLAGLELWYAAIEFVVLIFLVGLVMARSTAEAGMPMTETSFRPMDLVQLAFPMHRIGDRNLTVLGFLDAIFVRDQRGLVLTAYLDGSKLGDGVGMARRDLGKLCLWAIVISVIAAGAFSLAIPYNLGGVSLYHPNYMQYPLWEFRAHQPAMTGAVAYEPSALLWFAFGAALTAFTAWMRVRYTVWPFVPLAFTVSSAWTLIVFWFSILGAWLLKTLIFRYGGMRAFQRARPLFLGMILGEFTMILVWSVVAFATRTPMPIFAWW